MTAVYCLVVLQAIILIKISSLIQGDATHDTVAVNLLRNILNLRNPEQRTKEFSFNYLKKLLKSNKIAASKNLI